jgi:hypothetical protein
MASDLQLKDKFLKSFQIGEELIQQQEEKLRKTFIYKENKKYQVFD